MLGDDLPTPPVNVGFRSTPNYDALAAAAVRQLPDGIAGVRRSARRSVLRRSERVRSARRAAGRHRTTSDSLAGFNVHTIAIEVPIAHAHRERRASVVGDRSERRHRRLVHGEPALGDQSRQRPGEAQQRTTCRSRASVSRSSTRSSSRAARRTCSTRSSRPTTRAALPFVTDPEVPKLLLGALRHSVAAGAAQRSRHDLPHRHSRTESAAEA